MVFYKLFDVSFHTDIESCFSEKISSNMHFGANIGYYFLLFLVKIACVVSFWRQEIAEEYRI